MTLLSLIAILSSMFFAITCNAAGVTGTVSAGVVSTATMDSTGKVTVSMTTGEVWMDCQKTDTLIVCNF